MAHPSNKFAKDPRDRLLKKSGFGGLGDPSLCQQLAFACVRDHEQFRKMLVTVEPQLRHEAYTAMAPHLRFKAKPLADYILESARMAEQEQLPHYDPATLAITAWKPQEIVTSEFRKKLTEKVEKALSSEGTTKSLRLECRKCTRVEIFPALTPVEARGFALRDGWRFHFTGEGTKRREVARCPDCSNAGPLIIEA